MASKKNPLTDVLANKKATLKKVAEKPPIETKDLPAGSAQSSKLLVDLPIDLPITDLPIPIPIDAKPETKVLAIKRATLKKVGAEKTETKSDLKTQSMLKPIDTKPETQVLAMKKATLKKVGKKSETKSDLPTQNMLKPIISKAKSTNDLPSISKNILDDPNTSKNLTDENVIT